MKERLIELLRKSGASFERALPEEIADYLLANGVIVLPCKVGDTVYCDIKNKGKGYLDESIIKRVEFEQGDPEPLFTVICYEKADYQTYWASEFGKLFFNEPHFLTEKPKKRKALAERSEGK